MTFVAVPPTDTPGTTPGRPPRSPLPVVLAALVAVALAFGSLAAALVAVDAGRDEGAARAAGRAAFGSRLPDDLFRSLQDERNFGTVSIVGIDSALDLPVTSFPQATAATDAALAGFRARLHDQGRATRRAFGPIVDGLGAKLTALRAQVIGVRGERSVRQIDKAQSVFAGYKAQIDRLLSADRSIALAIDDPTLRRGVQLLDLGSRQEERSGSLVREIVVLGITGDGATDTGEARQLGQDLDALRATGADIDRLATGAFAPAARSTAEARGAAAGPAEEALLGGKPPMIQAVDLGGTTDHNAFVTFRTGVAKVMDRHVAAEIGEAHDREVSATTVAVLLGIAALAAAAATIALALTRRPQA
jgi:Nitrate and nitrite sensing